MREPSGDGKRKVFQFFNKLCFLDLLAIAEDKSKLSLGVPAIKLDTQLLLWKL